MGGILVKGGDLPEEGRRSTRPFEDRKRPSFSVDVEELTNQKEIEDILNRVLDAVAPMHKVVATSSESEFKARLAR